MYKISFKKSVAKDLKHLDKTQAKRILDKIESELSFNADRFPELKGKFSGLRKYRVGEYRVIFSLINCDTVLITRIMHRRNVYK